MRKLLAIFGVLSILSFATIVHADTALFQPDGDVGTPQWLIYPASPTTHFDKVADGILQPTAGDLTDYINAAATGGLIDIFNTNTIAGTNTATNVTVWAYTENPGYVTYGNRIYVKVSTTGGGWTTLTDISSHNDLPREWHYVSFDGSWTQANLDDLQIHVEDLRLGAAARYVYSLYAVVTYTASGGSTQAYFIKKKKGIVFIK